MCVLSQVANCFTRHPSVRCRWKWAILWRSASAPFPPAVTRRLSLAMPILHLHAAPVKYGTRPHARGHACGQVIQVYLNTTTCRRAFLLRHFDEEYKYRATLACEHGNPHVLAPCRNDPDTNPILTRNGGVGIYLPHIVAGMATGSGVVTTVTVITPMVGMPLRCNDWCPLYVPPRDTGSKGDAIEKIDFTDSVRLLLTAVRESGQHRTLALSNSIILMCSHSSPASRTDHQLNTNPSTNTNHLHSSQVGTGACGCQSTYCGFDRSKLCLDAHAS